MVYAPVLMPPVAIVRPVQLPDESLPVCRPIRHESPVTATGVPCEVQIDNRWLPAVVIGVQYSTAHVVLTPK